MNLQILKAELTGDPESRGYAGMNDAEAAADLNTVYRSVDVETVTGQQIFEAVVPAHYNALTAEQKQLFGVIVGMGTFWSTARTRRRPWLRCSPGPWKPCRRWRPCKQRQ